MLERPLWYCPFFRKLTRKDERRTVLCEGGCQMGFDDFPSFDAFADRYCRSARCRDCTIAQARWRAWGVEPDGR